MWRICSFDMRGTVDSVCKMQPVASVYRIYRYVWWTDKIIPQLYTTTTTYTFEGSISLILWSPIHSIFSRTLLNGLNSNELVEVHFNPLHASIAKQFFSRYSVDPKRTKSGKLFRYHIIPINDEPSKNVSKVRVLYLLFFYNIVSTLFRGWGCLLNNIIFLYKSLIKWISRNW